MLGQHHRDQRQRPRNLPRRATAKKKPWYLRLSVWAAIGALLAGLGAAGDFVLHLRAELASASASTKGERDSSEFNQLFPVEAKKLATERAVHLQETYESGFPEEAQVLVSVAEAQYSRGDTINVWYARPEGALTALVNESKTCVAILTGYHVFRESVSHLGISSDVPQVATEWTFHALVPEGVTFAPLVQNNHLPGDGGRPGDWTAVWAATGEKVGPLLTKGALKLDRSLTVPGSRDTTAVISVLPSIELRDTLQISLQFDGEDGSFEGTATLHVKLSAKDIDGGLEARDLAGIEHPQLAVAAKKEQ